MLVEPNAGAGLGHDRCERGLTDLKRITPQVVAVQLNEVEGVEEYVLVSAVVTDEIERGNAVVIAGDSFAVDNARARAQPGERINDQREAAGEVIAGPAVELHLRAGAFFPRQTANIFANQLGGTRRNGLAPRHSDIGIVVNEVTHRGRPGRMPV